MGCSDIERLMQYFNGVSEMMELFEALDKKVRAAFPKSTRRIQKSQISYDAQGHLFCALSKPVHRQKGWPAVSMILTFGLGTPLDSPRIFSGCTALSGPVDAPYFARRPRGARSGNAGFPGTGLGVHPA